LRIWFCVMSLVRLLCVISLFGAAAVTPPSLSRRQALHAATEG